MDSRTKNSVVESLEVTSHTLPYIPYLLQDLWALGCSVDQLVDLLAPLKLPRTQTQLLDLGCGKGAASIRIAATYGFRAVGIDAMSSFLKEARAKAEEYGVSHLCRFEEQDILKYVSVEHDFDLVILASLGGIFGSINDTISILRTQVQSNGFIIISDGYLKHRKRLNRKGYAHYKNHDDTVRELTGLNDNLISEISTSAAAVKMNREYLGKIRNRGRELAIQHPELKEDLADYIQLQEDECRVLSEEVEEAIWVLQKKS